MSNFNRRNTLFGAAAMSGLTALPLAAFAQGAEAIPPRPELDVFAADPLISNIALSPDGTRIAYITQKGDDKYLAYFDLANPKPKKIMSGKSKIRNIFFVDNDHVVIVISITASIEEMSANKTEVYSGIVINLIDASNTILFEKTDKYRPIVTGDLQRIKQGNTYKIYASNYETDGYKTSLFSFDLNSRIAHRVHEGSADTQNWVVTPDGNPVAFCDFDRDHNTWTLFYNQSALGQDTHFKRVYTLKNSEDVPVLLGLGRDGNSVVIKLNSDKNGGDYFEVRPDGSLSEALDSNGQRGARSALFHPTTGRLAGFSRHDDWFTYDYFDPLMKKLATALPQIIGEDYRLSIADTAEDPRKMIIYSEGADDSGSYYFYNFATGDNISIGSNYPNLPAYWTTIKQPISYKASDGLEINGYLTLPPGKEAKNLPLIVLPHGGPEVRDHGNFDWQVQALASRGYCVLQPNFRGSSGYGLEFIAAGYGQWGRKMQTDLSDGVRHLAKLGIIDAKRVAIVGASYGGYAALAGATLDQGIYRCAVSVAGISDLNSMLDFDAKKFGNGSIAIHYMKQQLGDPKTYNDISPAKQAKSAYCPILLIHGTDDTVVGIDQSRRMNDALKSAGKPVEFITYKGQDHWESYSSSRIAMIKATVAFLDKHNPA